MEPRIRLANLGFLLCIFCCTTVVSAADLLTIESDSVKVGIDGEKGGAITWLSSHDYSRNIVNIADPGRLIQQSYYAGRRLDRTAEGQSQSWSPWPWNPIQGGGVGGAANSGTWARVTAFWKDAGENTLYSETIPKLWDMSDEEAESVMRQWTTLEPDMRGVVRVRCEFQSMRQTGDRWGEARLSSQEVPACYFTRNFATVRTYLGEGKWREERQPLGPPWGRTAAPRKSMAMFEPSGQGVAIFSPVSGETWNFGPHGGGLSDNPTDGPCMHVAPVERVPLGRKSIYRYRYWLVVGDDTQIASRLDKLWTKYSAEQSQLTEPPN